MNKKAPLIGFIIGVLLLTTVVSYYKFFLEKEETFLMDNPTEQSLNITLNGKKYFLAPKQTTYIEILDGKNTISAVSKEGDMVLKDTFFLAENSRRCVVNPTLSDYYIFRRYYGYIKNIDSLYKAHKTVIGGKEYFGEIKIDKNLFINDFYFNIDQDFAKIVNKGDSIESRTKIFRKNQFLEFYRSNYE
ncbi:MAG: hypothetical protein LBT29_07420 [Flavobacteriaceae bacterium]|jgi:hypothetical protein|nr:hypothetical protein [Flavobacteriaceae bacterium]